MGTELAFRGGALTAWQRESQSSSRGGSALLDRKGFTLIELLLVVVIIGIPKFANTKEKAYVASMKSDLRNMVTAEESYFADYTTYTANLGTTFSASNGVTFAISSVTGTGWTATASHNGTTSTCTIAIGAAAGTGAEGQPICT